MILGFKLLPDVNFFILCFIYRSQGSKHRRTDRSVMCCLRKAESGKSWPRLTKEKAKVSNFLLKDELCVYKELGDYRTAFSSKNKHFENFGGLKSARF